MLPRPADAAARRNAVARFVLVAFVLVLGMALGRLALQGGVVHDLAARYGYAGVFVIAAISGFNLAVPIPAVAFVPVFVGAGLRFPLVVTAIVLGITVADLASFLLGSAGRDIVGDKERRMLKRLESFRARHERLPLVFLFFYAAFVPLPNQIVLIPLGLMGYRLVDVLPPLIAATAVFNALAAYGVQALFSRL